MTVKTKPRTAASKTPASTKTRRSKPTTNHKLVNRWPMSRIDELMPWAYGKTAEIRVKV